MLHILFVIIKIIGILLAVILGLLIAVILCVLFVPIRYQGTAEAAGDLSSIKAEGKGSWLLHLIAAYVKYEGQTLEWRFRIAWKTISNLEEKAETVIPPEEKEEEPEEAKEEPKALPEKEVKEASEEPLPEEEAKEEPKALPEEEAKEEPEEPLSEEEAKEEPKPLPEEDEQSGKEKRSKRKKWKKTEIGRFFQRIEYTFHSICDKIKALSDKGKSLEETKERIQDFIEDETHRNAFYKGKDELIRLLKKIRPSSVQAQLHFGMEDPYLTGQILAVLAMIYPFLGKGVSIQPDFEHQVLEGKIRIKGRIRVIHFVAPICRMFFDSRVKATYRDIKTFKNKRN